jgi:hypothetical protein
MVMIHSSTLLKLELHMGYVYKSPTPASHHVLPRSCESRVEPFKYLLQDTMDYNWQAGTVLHD